MEELTRRIAASDEAAFETLFRRVAEPLFQYVVGMTRSESAAHDVVQETFAKLWSVRERLEDVDALKAYVFQMARRRVYNLHRDERVRRDNEALLDEDDLAAFPDAPDAEVDAEMLRDLLESWIDELPDRQREALTLRRIEGLSHEAIADVMGITKNTVNTHLVRAMEHLRSRLRSHRPDLLR
jgi:RNA polymerase sigma-70 factor (ECF subfamily)